jgi:agmatinase
MPEEDELVPALGADRGGPAYPFVGIPSFLRTAQIAGRVPDLARIAVLGVPADFGSPFMPGSRFGPRGIREHSLRFGTEGYFDGRLNRTLLQDELRTGAIVDMGDVDVLPNNVPMTFDRISRSIRDVVGLGVMPVVFGGDHSVTYPVVKGFDRPIHVLHFDAHIDYSPYIHGYGPTNMTPMRYVAKLPQVRSLTQVGIRSIRNSKSNVDASKDDGNRVVTLEEARDLGASGLFAAIEPGDAVYVSIDIDVLDMSLVPGCVSAEPDGFSYRELRDLLWAISENFEVVGFDLVEVNPMLDVPTGATSYLAAHAIVEFLGAITSQDRWSSGLR